MTRLLLPLLIIATPALAYEELSSDAFFKVKENQDKFEFLAQSGAIEKLKAKAKSICEQSAYDHENPEIMCECFAKETDKISDEDYFYSSMLAYQRYQAKAAAMQNNDTAELENIEKVSQANPLFAQRAEQICRISGLE